ALLVRDARRRRLLHAGRGLGGGEGRRLRRLRRGVAGEGARRVVADERRLVRALARVERLRERLRVLPALLSLLRERPEDHALEGLGDLGALRARRRRRLLDLLLQELHRALAGEGDLSREHLIEDDADGVEVGARVDGLTASLLGGHVSERP